MQNVIIEIFGIHPSNSGNTRVMASFKNRGDIHFYMKPNGDLHIPSQHDEKTLSDNYEAYREFQWVEKTWRKTNKAVVNEVLKGEMRQKAFHLAMKLADPAEWKKVMQVAMIAKRSQGKMGDNSDLSTKLKDIKKDIHKENRSKPAEQPETVKPVQQVKAVVEQPKKVVLKKVELTSSVVDTEEVKPNYGGCRIEKFNKRYEKTKTANG